MAIVKRMSRPELIESIGRDKIVKFLLQEHPKAEELANLLVDKLTPRDLATIQAKVLAKK